MIRIESWAFNKGGTRSCQESDDVSKTITFGGFLGSQERKGTKGTLRQWDPYIHSELYPVLARHTPRRII